MTSEHPITDAVIQQLDLIAQRDQDNLIQPEAVVEEAASETSPLHPHFEWDDDEAAHEYRLHQARNLIRAVRVVKIDPGPRYVNITIKRENGVTRRGYVATERAVADPDLYEQVVMDTMRAMRGYRLRLAAFQQARKAVDSLDDTIVQLQESIQAPEEE